MDNYYYPKEQQCVDENGVHNFDLPTSLNNKKIVTDMQQLQEGNKVILREYTFNNDQKTAEDIVLEPTPILIVEGLFLFHEHEIAQLLESKLFIDTPLDICLERRIVRDRARNYDADDAKYRFKHHVLPSYSRYIDPYRNRADMQLHGIHTPEFLVKNACKKFQRSKKKR